VLNAESKISKDAIMDIDDKVIKKVVYNTWIHTVMYDEDIEYKGDINIIARASEYLVVQDMLQARRQEFLGMTNNDIDMQIIGIEGRARVLREIANGLKLSENPVPDDQDLAARIEMSMMQRNAAMMQPGGAPGGAAGPGAGPVGPIPGGQPTEGGSLPPMEPSAIESISGK
jgi:hypothetical protein